MLKFSGMNANARASTLIGAVISKEVFLRNDVSSSNFSIYLKKYKNLE